MPTPVATVADRVPPENRQRLQTPLTTATIGSLRAMMTMGLMRPITPPEHAAELIAAGYARETFGGLSLTDTGQIRAMMENGQ